VLFRGLSECQVYAEITQNPIPFVDMQTCIYCIF